MMNSWMNSRNIHTTLWLILVWDMMLPCCARSACRECVQTMPNQYGKLSTVTQLPKPKPECMVCGHAMACLFLDLETFTFQQLLDFVLKKEMAFSHPTVMCENFLYEEGDDLDEDEVEEYAKLLPKTIASLPGNVSHNKRLDVTDQTQNLKVTLVLQQQVRGHRCFHACGAAQESVTMLKGFRSRARF
jgi:hypothetical protein